MLFVCSHSIIIFIITSLCISCRKFDQDAEIGADGGVGEHNAHTTCGSGKRRYESDSCGEEESGGVKHQTTCGVSGDENHEKDNNEMKNDDDKEETEPPAKKIK